MNFTLHSTFPRHDPDASLAFYRDTIKMLRYVYDEKRSIISQLAARAYVPLIGEAGTSSAEVS